MVLTKDSARIRREDRIQFATKVWRKEIFLTWEPKTLISKALAVYLSGTQLLPLPHVSPMGMELSLAERISLLLPQCPTFIRELREFRDDNEARWTQASCSERNERRGVRRLVLRGRAKSCADPFCDESLADTDESNNRTRDLASA